MKRTVAITCLLLLAVGSVAVWGAALCPGEHHMATMGPMDNCPMAACCIAAGPVPARASEEGRLQVVATASVVAYARAATTPHLFAADQPRFGGPSPGASQTTPVLLL